MSSFPSRGQIAKAPPKLKGTTIPIEEIFATDSALRMLPDFGTTEISPSDETMSALLCVKAIPVMLPEK
jgi:hypothetical protein